MTEHSENPHPSENSLRLLKALGVLDSSNQITPEAYIGYVQRTPLGASADSRVDFAMARFGGAPQMRDDTA